MRTAREMIEPSESRTEALMPPPPQSIDKVVVLVMSLTLLARRALDRPVDRVGLGRARSGCRAGAGPQGLWRTGAGP